jgi:hypothetical protein
MKLNEKTKSMLYAMLQVEGSSAPAPCILTTMSEEEIAMNNNAVELFELECG